MVYMTTVHEGFNICDPNDWPEQGQCCGLNDCHMCPDLLCEDRKPSLVNPTWNTPNYIKNGSIIDGLANAHADERHNYDNYYNEI